MPTVILTDADIRARLRRIAYQIYERNYQADSLVLVGVSGRGYHLAQALAEYLVPICPLDTRLYSFDEVQRGALAAHPAGYRNSTILLVDDVVYSGGTLLSALTAVRPFAPAKVQTVLLVDRGHRSLPIAIDYVGLELATTLQDFVYVRLDAAARQAEVLLYDAADPDMKGLVGM